MSYKRYYSYPSRTICDILADMRKCYSTYQFGSIAGLIEELQARANRMEAALDDQKEFHEIMDKRAEAKDYLRKLEKQIEEAEKKVEELGLGSKD